MKFNPFDRSAKTAPSSYPRVVFHGIRTAQLISSVVVGGIMSYFIWHLTHDHWSTPWTFIWLTAASLFSIAALIFTIVLHCFIGLNPRLNIAINSFLLLLWVLSWALLTYYMSGTLAGACDKAHWHEDTGIMVCNIYKALFSFTLFGFLSTAAALALDIYVRRQQTKRGIYRLQDLDTKRPEATRGPYTDNNGERDIDHANDPRESLAWEEPRPSMGPYSEQGHDHAEQGFSDLGDMGASRNGYAVPEGQFGYDTQYHGGHSEGSSRA